MRRKCSSMLPFLDRLLFEAVDRDCWLALADKSVLITGGTGLIGKWWLAGYLYASQQLSFYSNLYVVSRNPEKFTNQFPEYDLQEITWIKGDVRSARMDFSHFDYVLHMATEASATLSKENPYEMFSTIVDGTRNVLESVCSNSKSRMLYVSSGGVYGRQTGVIDEDMSPNLDILSSSNCYCVGKITAEHLCSLYEHKCSLNMSIARIFAVIGPYLSLNSHFAIGNFMNDALASRNIVIKSDGKVTRSYLYFVDVIRWLMAVLINGTKGEAYNIGADEAVTLHEAAGVVQECCPKNIKVEVLGRDIGDSLRNIYLPDTSKTKKLFKVPFTVSFYESVAATLEWNGQVNAG